MSGKFVQGASMLPESSAYVEAYGLVQPQDNNYLERTYGIFNKLKRISGRASRSAKLLVINSPDKPWAIALADGNVVLSAGSLNIVYGENDLETGDAWMAFVLGHELAHLANRDMWHHQMHLVHNIKYVLQYPQLFHYLGRIVSN